MKNVLMTFALAILTIGGIQAQESITGKAQSTLKTEIKSDTDASANQVKRSETKTDAEMVKSTTKTTTTPSATAIKDDATNVDKAPTKPANTPKKQKSTMSKSQKVDMDSKADIDSKKAEKAKIENETTEKKAQLSTNPN